MADIIPFQFGNHEVRIRIDDDGNPWWVLKDVCTVLGLKDAGRAADRLEPSESMSIPQSSALHSELKMLIVNESGFYRLIMRSDKPEAKRFQHWVFHDVLPTLRKTGKYEVPVAEPPSYHAQLDKLRAYAEFAESLNLLEDRDKLMLKDMARTLLPHYIGPPGESLEQKTVAEASGFFLADRVRRLGYCLTRKEEAQLMSKGLARAVSQEYRQQHGKDPIRSQRFVDGAIRPVFWYSETEASWIDPLIQTWCARLGMTT